MHDIVAACRLLGDENRLRLLRVLGRGEFNVSELTAILCIAQSGVSRHLRLLREAGLVAERREGSWAYFALNGADGTTAARVFGSARALLDTDGDPHGDLARVEEVMRLRRERSSSPFDSSEGLPVPGRSWVAWSRALHHLVGVDRALDVGCGDGGLAVELARSAREVVAIDRSRTMIERARLRARRAGSTNVRFEEGELEALPLADASVDLCVLSQILHHAARPPGALAEAARVLGDGGRLLILDLMPHQEEWVRERLGDQWLGFDPAQLARLLESAGFESIRTERVPRRQGEPFEVLIASAVRPARGHPARAQQGDDRQRTTVAAT